MEQKKFSENGKFNNSQIEFPDDIKDFACIIDDILYVVDTKKNSASCINFVSWLKKSGRISKKIVVTFPQLKQKKRQAEEAVKTNNVSHTNDVDTSDVVKFAVDIIDQAARTNTSDIHIRSHADFSDILFRIDGSLRIIKHVSTPFAKLLFSTIYTVLAEGDSASHPYYQPNAFQDARIVDFEYLPTNVHSVRIASGAKVGGNFMVLRLLYAETEETSGSLEDRLGDLGYSSKQVNTIAFMKSRPTGINIIAGPTGSGKSTTLKHNMEAISQERPDQNIMSVEDPPEYPMYGVVQIPVTNTEGNEERENAFGAAIRMALRSDPDIIMIGEIRDQESALLSFRAAQTGHQVWTTLHANSAFGIITRLVDILASETLSDPYTYISDPTILTGLIFQKLVRTICPYCKIPLVGNEDKISSNVLGRLSRVIDIQETNVHIKGPGCHECNRTGILGRTIVSETVSPDPEMLKIMRREKSVEAARQYWLEKQEGKTYLHHAIVKIAKGELDPAETEKSVGPLVQDLIFSDGVLEEKEIDEINVCY